MQLNNMQRVALGVALASTVLFAVSHDARRRTSRMAMRGASKAMNAADDMMGMFSSAKDRMMR